MRRSIREGLVLGLMALSCLAGLARASDCTRTSTGRVPLIDLGPGLYQGFPGGLYPEGLNQCPDAHLAAGVSIAQSIGPLDSLGTPDSVSGKVVLISIGMSNATQEFQAFVPKAMADPLKKRNVQVVDCAVGGMSADRIRTPGAAYWDSVYNRLHRAGLSPLQPQAVWIKEANAGPRGGFPASAESLQWNLAAIVRIIKQKMPNVKLCYLTSRIYAGYATTTLNPEPYAYESGFAVKWLIDSQIRGDSLNYDETRGPVEAPWLAWGPYLWADGLNARSDGLTWPCDFFQTDGTHPAAGARNLVADSLLAFFRRNATTSSWWSGTITAAPEGTSPQVPSLVVAPNPSSSGFRISLAPSTGVAWRVQVFDVSGRLVRSVAHGTGTGAPVSIAWDGRDQRGRRPGGGVYWVRLEQRGAELARRAVLLEPH